MPDLTDVMSFFEEVRSSYIRALEHAIRVALEKNPGARVLQEVVAKTEDSSYKTCWDLAIEKSDGNLEPVLVDLHRFLPWEAARIRMGNLSVDVEPFLWHVCTLVARPALAQLDLTPLAHWFDRWFERPQEPGERFRNAVHWMSDPEIKHGHLFLQIDRGTAHTDALVDLLNTLGALGATSAALYTSPDYATTDPDIA